MKKKYHNTSTVLLRVVTKTFDPQMKAGAVCRMFKEVTLKQSLRYNSSLEHHRKSGFFKQNFSMLWVSFEKAF